MRALIIENEKSAQELLSKIVTNYCPNVEIVGILETIGQAVDAINNIKPDFIFLDIELDEGSSFSILDQVSYKQFKIIFTTAHEEYALKAFKYAAIDYILKPYNPEDIKEAIGRIPSPNLVDNLKQDVAFLVNQAKAVKDININIPTSEGIQFIVANDIVRIEADRSYSKVFTKDGEIIYMSKPMKNIADQLDITQFFKSHSSHIVNLSFIKMYSKQDGGMIIMKDGSQIPIARLRKNQFLDLISK